MTPPTRAEWERRTLAAYADEGCPKCGNRHSERTVDDWGNVWIHCPHFDQDFYLDTEPVPATFAPEPADPADLPF